MDLNAREHQAHGWPLCAMANGQLGNGRDDANYNRMARQLSSRWRRALEVLAARIASRWKGWVLMCGLAHLRDSGSLRVRQSVDKQVLCVANALTAASRWQFHDYAVGSMA